MRQRAEHAAVHEAVRAVVLVAKREMHRRSPFAARLELRADDRVEPARHRP
jgi:hypothetical protein